MNIYEELAKIFTNDAEFNFFNGKEHYYKRKNRGDIPKEMSMRQFFKKSKEVCLKNVNGKSVRAYKAGGRTIKCDGSWIVAYAGGKNGTLITSYPASMSVFETKMKNNKGEEIFKEA